ncbi:B-cell receptor CD22-like [Anoplopoma fimbria]|uniref:B-cell receptor CD22-like n=1 Tax=Anoplopoma fimbria TaxID=229290 RepID=UPI0023EAED31|nr:B-cell receptor CD22-like [Anoplopoma fimbria]
MSSTAAASGFVVFLLSVQVIQSEGGWGVTYTPTEVCAEEGSTVEIHCTYTYPSRIQHRDIKEAFWFKQKGGEPVDLRTDSEYSGRVQYRCDEKKCTLIITNVIKSDSAEYKFRFRTNKQYEKYSDSPGVTLSFTDPGLQVKVSRSDLTWSLLECHSSYVLPDNPSYIWYKNGQHIKRTSSSYSVYFGSADSYSCAVRGSENHCSPPVYAPKLPSVSVSPSDEIVEGSSVNLTCSSDANPAANYTWYKEGEDSPKASGQIFTITGFRAEHSGNYYCEAQNNRGRSNSTFHLITVAGSMTTVAVGSTAAIFLAIIILAAFLLIRRKRSSTQTSEPGERPDNDAQIKRSRSSG